MSYPQLPEPSGAEPSAVELSTARDPRLGVAYAVTLRNEGGGEDRMTEVVLTYRLRRWGPEGRELPAVAVEMRGPRLQGMVAEGDLIQTPDPLPTSGTAQLETVTNLTTGSTVALQRPRLGPVGTGIVVLVAVLILGFIAYVLVQILSSPF